jgi:hypothetical protein
MDDLLVWRHNSPRHRRPHHRIVISVAGKTSAAECGEPHSTVVGGGHQPNILYNINMMGCLFSRCYCAELLYLFPCTVTINYVYHLASSYSLHLNDLFRNLYHYHFTFVKFTISFFLSLRS